MDITELAGHALHIMKRWNWDYINPISGHISHNIKLRDALGKLAFDGCTDPESALLQLFCDGSIEAIGDFYWLRYQQKKFYSLSGTQEPIKKEMWSKLRNLREEAKQLYPDQNPDLLKCDLVQLAMQDISKANWGHIEILLNMQFRCKTFQFMISIITRNFIEYNSLNLLLRKLYLHLLPTSQHYLLVTKTQSYLSRFPNPICANGGIAKQKCVMICHRMSF